MGQVLGAKMCRVTESSFKILNDINMIVNVG